MGYIMERVDVKIPEEVTFKRKVKVNQDRKQRDKINRINKKLKKR